MKKTKKILSIFMVVTMILMSTSVFAANNSVVKPKKSSAKRSASLNITVKWSKAKGADKYQIYRSTSKNGTYKKIKTVGASKRSYVNKSLKNNKRYYYKVRSVKVTKSKTYKSKFSSKSSAKTRAGITYTEARKIALKKTGGGYVDDIELDYERGVKVYEVSVKKGNYEYDLDIRYSDGKIVKCTKEYDD